MLITKTWRTGGTYADVVRAEVLAVRGPGEVVAARAAGSATARARTPATRARTRVCRVFT
jgi:hypothetical protein